MFIPTGTLYIQYNFITVRKGISRNIFTDSDGNIRHFGFTGQGNTWNRVMKTNPDGKVRGRRRRILSTNTSALPNTVVTIMII